VPEQTVFVMGDNRPGSKDSREIGAVQYSDLLGRAFVVLWPTDDWQWL
jgi:signal peptidase I